MQVNNLWGNDITLDDNSENILSKVANPKKIKTTKEVNIKSKKLSISDKLSIINENVENILGVYKNTTDVIYNKEDLDKYINTAVRQGIIAIDTETSNSLDPITCKLMGLCIYTPGLNSAYVPVNHTDLSGDRLNNQVSEIDINEALSKVLTSKIIMHNGKFDYQVIKCTCDLALPITWDTMIGAKILDENERSAGLKQQYIDKIDSSIEKYSIDNLFEAIEYNYVDPEIFALYAATDAYMTYKLYEYQISKFNLPENLSLYNIMNEVEMPVIIPTAEMELTGVCLDRDYSKRLSKKYHDKSEKLAVEVATELDKLKPQIEKWRLSKKANEKTLNKKTGKYNKSLSEKLDNPIKLSSPTQLAILFYDILKIPAIDKSSPRGTGEEILKKIYKDYNIPICKLILAQRGLDKLINTYIDKLPECTNEKTGRIHASFNQYGADTGRFSSRDPNLQNIPSHNNEIRLMFCATPGYTMIGGDYSQQEPRMLSYYSQDENMINAYKENKDLYAMIASKVYKNNYEDNIEFHPETGAIQPDGKHRRASVKSLLLGIMYGQSTMSIAEKLECSIDEAESIKRGFFNSFPKVEKWITETNTTAKKTGYVEDAWGRRRRLPDILLPEYEVTSSNLSAVGFNPLLHTSGVHENKEQQALQESYLNRLKTAKSFQEKNSIKSEAAKNNITIKSNGGFINRAERQCVNARIQGGSASMSKRAMTKVHYNDELNKLGFRLLIAVHDELIGECPEENAEKCKELLSECMKSAAQPVVNVPMKCDCDSFHNWYEDVYASEIKKEYTTEFFEDKNGKKIKNNLFNNFEALYEKHCECTKEQLYKIIN